MKKQQLSKAEMRQILWAIKTELRRVNRVIEEGKGLRGISTEHAIRYKPELERMVKDFEEWLSEKR